MATNREQESMWLLLGNKSPCGYYWERRVHVATIREQETMWLLLGKQESM